jgi:hypothetical protein
MGMHEPRLVSLAASLIVLAAMRLRENTRRGGDAKKKR